MECHSRVLLVSLKGWLAARLRSQPIWTIESNPTSLIVYRKNLMNLEIFSGFTKFANSTVEKAFCRKRGLNIDCGVWLSV